jgi:probable rRNA maturation factor
MWDPNAELKRLLRRARAQPALRKRAPGRAWQVELALVGSARMTALNARYRGKRRPTDVLSFPAPKAFRAAGHLGELVICLPVLRAQAREHLHAPEQELRVLLSHGLLHLLGFDHEKGEAQARAMSRWEARLLGTKASGLGLIRRSR